MKLQRLARMDMAEIAVRSRQEIAKRLDRMGVSRLGAPPVASVGDLHERAPRRFFEGPTDGDTARRLSERLPGHAEAVLAAAERVLEGRFDLLGYEDLRFGEPIDWHLDPVAGRRSPRGHWTGLRFLDPQIVGDSKVVWELNRHQWLVTLAQAYALTRDERYPRAVVRHLRAWEASNPYGIGINWASSLEVALRLVSWSWTLMLLRGSPALSPSVMGSIARSMARHAAHVERYLSYYFAPNTHLTGEALGLLYAAALLGDRVGARWSRLGGDILIEQSARQVLDDGVYFEQSTVYQRYTVEFYLHFIALAIRGGRALPPEIGERVQKMLDFLLAVRGGNGEGPQIGDADGGWLLPLVRRAPGDWRGVFSTAAVLFRRADYAWAAGDLAPETLWTLGPRAERTFDSLEARPPASASRAFTVGGYAVMRTGWESDSHQLLMDFGPLGCPVSGGHGHADLLSIQCSVFGRPAVVDPGTGVYTGDAAWRDFFRSSHAHATLLVDGRSQAEPAGPFAWRRRPRADGRRWSSCESYDLLAAEHRAYGGEDPIVHRRTALFVKPRFWMLVDELEGGAVHDFELRFPFAPIPVDSAGPWVRARVAGGRGLLLRSFASVPLATSVVEGSPSPRAGWFSADYGRREPAPMAIVSGRASLPLRIVTLLLPADDVSVIPRVEARDGDAEGPRGVFIDDIGVGATLRGGEIELTAV